jgi:putative ABC transport system ATP-binding protein
MMYSVNDVSVRFQSRASGGSGAVTLALDRVSLSIKHGELVVIMGPSGSGKSTLLHVLAGLASVDAGDVMFRPDEDGPSVALSAAGEDARARLRGSAIGFVYQAFNLIPTMTAAENVALPLLFRGVARKIRDERALAMIERVGLRNLAERYPAELSGGEQQRIAIARALVFDPVVLLADEPTGSLDSTSAQAVLELFRGLHAERGITIIIVTHDPGVAEQLTKRVVRMRDGRLEGAA